MSAVIVTAMAYRHEIENELRNAYLYKGKIVFLGEILEVAEFRA